MDENNNGVNGFTFFKSYYDAIKQLSPDAQTEFLLAIFKYEFDDVEPEITDPIAKMAWTLMYPNLRKSKLRSKASKSKTEQTEDKTETKSEQTDNKSQQNADKTETKNIKTETNDEQNGNKSETKSNQNENKTETKGCFDANLIAVCSDFDNDLIGFCTPMDKEKDKDKERFSLSMNECLKTYAGTQARAREDWAKVCERLSDGFDARIKPTAFDVWLRTLDALCVAHTAIVLRAVNSEAMNRAAHMLRNTEKTVTELFAGVDDAIDKIVVSTADGDYFCV